MKFSIKQKNHKIPIPCKCEIGISPLHSPRGAAVLGTDGTQDFWGSTTPGQYSESSTSLSQFQTLEIKCPKIFISEKHASTTYNSAYEQVTLLLSSILYTTHDVNCAKSLGLFAFSILTYQGGSRDQWGSLQDLFHTIPRDIHTDAASRLCNGVLHCSTCNQLIPSKSFCCHLKQTDFKNENNKTTTGKVILKAFHKHAKMG